MRYGMTFRPIEHDNAISPLHANSFGVQFDLMHASRYTCICKECLM